MITINGQKMGKSLGNFITLEQFETGDHPLLAKAYSPMTIRFFMLQAQYRGTLDFSNEALQSAEKGLQRLMEGYAGIDRIPLSENSTLPVADLYNKCIEALNDDLNSPIAVAHLFEAVRLINLAIAGNEKVDAASVEMLRKIFDDIAFSVLGLSSEISGEGSSDAFGKVVDMLLEERFLARQRKDFAASDRIRDALMALGFEIKDSKEGSTWTYKKG
jgi:cysteinyl-tRNA synthetase